MKKASPSLTSSYPSILHFPCPPNNYPSPILCCPILQPIHQPIHQPIPQPSPQLTAQFGSSAIMVGDSPL